MSLQSELSFEIEADDALVAATKRAGISEAECAAAVTKRTIARNSLEATAKAS